MKIEVIEKTKDHAEFKLIGERHTLSGLLVEALIEDPKVEYASYNLAHPLDKDSIIIVQTKGKAPLKALTDAAATVRKQVKNFQKATQSAFK